MRYAVNPTVVASNAELEEWEFCLKALTFSPDLHVSGLWSLKPADSKMLSDSGSEGKASSRWNVFCVTALENLRPLQTLEQILDGKEIIIDHENTRFTLGTLAKKKKKKKKKYSALI
eukprot:Trichotokara_eunicae@DN3992_c0_g1_i4.p2